MSRPFCPDCDANDVQYRVGDRDWKCKNCGSTIDEPVYREPYGNSKSTNSDHAAIMENGHSIDVCPECGRSAIMVAVLDPSEGRVVPCDCYVHPCRFGG